MLTTRETDINMETRRRYHVADWEIDQPERNDRLCIRRNGVEKIIFVVEDNGYIYRLLKTRIACLGGAKGIYDFLGHEIATCNYPSFAYKVLRHCFFVCREART